MIDALLNAYRERMFRMREQFNRSVSFGDLFTDRWQRARDNGFGEGTSVYDNVLIMGDVTVGDHVWVGPNCVLDGSGVLTIGDHCSISAGVQIYTHHTVRKATSMGVEPIDRAPTNIGDGVYLGPGTVVQMGVTIGDRAVIGALSLVNRDIAPGERVAGTPARPI